MTIQRANKPRVNRSELAALIDQFGDLHGEVLIPSEAYRFYCGTIRDHKLVGCVKLHPINWYQADLCHLVVHRDYRRQNIGRYLIEKACRRARRAECRIVQSTICLDNTAAGDLFCSIGFVPSITFTGLSGRTLAVWSLVL